MNTPARFRVARLRKEIQEADDPEAKLQEKVDEYSDKFAHPYRAAARGFVDEVIKPKDTKKILSRVKNGVIEIFNRLKDISPGFSLRTARSDNIDAFQKTLLQGMAPDFSVLWPGMLMTMLFIPISYLYFKRAEAYFADVI